MQYFQKLLGNSTVTIPVSGALLVIGGLLVFVHAMAIRELKEIGLPAAIELPILQKRLEILRDQVEASQLQEALKDGSAQEQLQAFVLPKESDLVRLLATFDLLHDQLMQERLLTSMSGIHVGTPVASSFPAVQALPITFEADLTQEGMDKLLLLVRLSGLITISDALASAEREALINLTEQENPAALTILEEFLSVGLLRYARDPKPFENQVLRSITSPTFEQQFTESISHSLLAKAKYLYGGTLGTLVQRHNLWPLQMMSLKRVDVEPLSNGRYHIAVVLEAYTKP